MRKAPKVAVPQEVWDELEQDDVTPVPILGDMSPWVSEYSFPYWMTPWEERCITLARRGKIGEDRWAILDGRHCYNRVRRIWQYEMSPSNRTDKFYEECRFTLSEARPIIVRQVFRMHRSALHRVARMVTLQRRNSTERTALKAERQRLATALNAYQTARESA